MNIRSRATSESFKEIVHQLGLKITNTPGADLRLNHRHCASAEIHCRETESLIHGHQEISGAQNAATVAESAVKGLAQTDSNIFDGMVLVDVEIADGGEFQVEGSVTSEKLEHVIKKTDAG